MRIPTLLVIYIAGAVDRLEVRGQASERLEILFGLGSIEQVGRAAMAELMTLREINGLPVSYPERPGPMPGAVLVRIVADDGAYDLVVLPDVVATWEELP